MRTLFILWVLSLCMSETTLAQRSVSEDFSRLSWLEGKWERINTKEGRIAFEVWKLQGAGFIGEGFTLQGGDTVFVEKLSISQQEGALYYVAEPSGNAAPTYFKIIRISDNGFISENPDHDFPTKIEYLLDEDSTMTATISGDGREIPFIFRKVK